MALHLLNGGRSIIVFLIFAGISLHITMQITIRDCFAIDPWRVHSTDSGESLLTQAEAAWVSTYESMVMENENSNDTLRRPASAENTADLNAYHEAKEAWENAIEAEYGVIADSNRFRVQALDFSQAIEKLLSKQWNTRGGTSGEGTGLDWAQERLDVSNDFSPSRAPASAPTSVNGQ